MTTPTRIAVAGIGGRMGREVAAAAAGRGDVALVAGLVRPGGAPPAGLGPIPVVDDPARLPPGVDVLVDFSRPAGAVRHAAWCAERGVALVCGVTGLDADQTERVWAAAERVPVFVARNLSAGVAALLRLLPALVAALPEADVEVVELHHRGKRDAPSGTALALAEAVAAARGQAASEVATFGRAGEAPRRPGEVGVHALRGGGNAGEHVVLLATDGEEIRVAHRALSRRAFADGALRAARFVAGRPPGRYGPADLFGGEGG